MCWNDVIFTGPEFDATFQSVHGEEFNDNSDIILHLHNIHYRLVQKQYSLGQWVIVNYDRSLYPGEIVQVNFLDYKVMVMKRSGKHWIWPSEVDSIYYEESNILRAINPPCVSGPRGQFSFPQCDELL